MSAVRTMADALASPEFVTTLRAVLDAIDEHQLPEPASIWSSPDQTTVYLASGDDLPAWLIAFDLPAPDWHLTMAGNPIDKVVRHATYVPSPATGLAFHLYVSDAVHLNVDADPVSLGADSLSVVGRTLGASDRCDDEMWQTARAHGFVADGRPAVVDADSFAHCCEATGGVTR